MHGTPVAVCWAGRRGIPDRACACWMRLASNGRKSLMLAIGFAAGLVLLVLGADLLVAGASRIAARMGISPLVIGLTVVAFGTSAPELGVSLQAVYSGQGAIALGNVVGSNIFNVLFILGLSAIVTPLAVKARLIRFDVPFMVAVSIAVYCLAWDGAYGRFDGVLLFGPYDLHRRTPALGSSAGRRRRRRAVGAHRAMVVECWQGGGWTRSTRCWCKVARGRGRGSCHVARG